MLTGNPQQHSGLSTPPLVLPWLVIALQLQLHRAFAVQESKSAVTHCAAICKPPTGVIQKRIRQEMEFWF